MATRDDIGTLIGWGWTRRTLREIASDGVIDELWGPIQQYYGVSYEKSKDLERLSCLNNLKRIRAAVGSLPADSECVGVDSLFYEYLGLLIDDQEKRNQNNGLQGAKSP